MNDLYSPSITPQIAPGTFWSCETSVGSPVSMSTWQTAIPGTPSPTKEEWIASMQAHLARVGVQRGAEREILTTDGPQRLELQGKYAPGSYCWNVWKDLPKSMTECETNFPQTVIRIKPASLMLPRWVLHILGGDIGVLHTPTTKANQCARSMQKWPSCRRLTAVFGRLTPDIQDWMMGIPCGLSDTGRLEMAKCQSPLLLLPDCSE